MTERLACVDAVRRHEQVGRHGEVGGREAERHAAPVAGDDRSLHLRRPPEEPRRGRDVAGLEQAPHVARGDVLHERDAPDVEAEPHEQVEVAAAPEPEAEAVARRDDVRPDRAQDRVGEHL